MRNLILILVVFAATISSAQITWQQYSFSNPQTIYNPTVSPDDTELTDLGGGLYDLDITRWLYRHQVNGAITNVPNWYTDLAALLQPGPKETQSIDEIISGAYNFLVVKWYYVHTALSETQHEYNGGIPTEVEATRSGFKRTELSLYYIKG